MNVRERDLLNNIGRPDLADCLDILDFKKEDIKFLKEKDQEFLDKYEDWQKCEDRKILVAIVNEWCSVFRCQSLIID